MHGLDRSKHGIEPGLHRREPPSWNARQVVWASAFEQVNGLSALGFEFVERRPLRVGRLHDLGDAIDRPLRELRSIIAAASAARVAEPCVCALWREVRSFACASWRGEEATLGSTEATGERGPE